MHPPRTPSRAAAVVALATLPLLAAPRLAAETTPTSPAAPAAPAAPTPPAATAPPAFASFGEAYRAAVAAHGAGDNAGFLHAMQAAARFQPDHPGVLYDLACAEALAGERDAALEHLGRVAAMEVAMPVGEDPDLAALRELPAFRAVADAMAAVARPLVASSEAARLADRELLVEGIAGDPAGGLLLSSVHRGSVLHLAPDGTLRERVPAGRDGLATPLGLAVDAPRGLLWVCSSGLPQTAGLAPDALGRGALHAFALADGAPRRRLPLAGGAAGHGCNDLAVAPDGTVYVADSPGGALLRLRPGSDALETVVAPGGPLVSPGGIALAGDGSALWLADWTRGLFRVALPEGTIAPVAPPPDRTLLRIDGLVRHGADLVAIQNGFAPARVMRLALAPGGDRVTRVETLERAHPAYVEPTLGTLDGDDLLYVAASGWPAFESGATADKAKLREPVVLRLPLGTAAAPSAAR